MSVADAEAESSEASASSDLELRELGGHNSNEVDEQSHNSDEGDDEKSNNDELVDQSPPIGRAHAAYQVRLVLLAKVLLSSVDHVTDGLVLADLYRRGLFSLFWTGLALDLLPGPATAVQFAHLGHSWWKCCLLLLHPINYYVHSALAFGKEDSPRGKFSALVAAYAKEAQGLLEAPMQLIFTTTLVCLRILPTPFEEVDSDKYVWENSYGGRINLSFVPVASIVFSLLMIVVNASKAAFSDDLSFNPASVRSSTSVLLFVMTNVLFRLHSWVFLCSFLDQFALPLILLVVLVNIVVVIRYSTEDTADPLLTSLFSTVIPIVSLDSLKSQSIQEKNPNRDSQRRVSKYLSISGTVILSLLFWLVYACVRFKLLGYSSETRLRRDYMEANLTFSLVTASAAILGAFLLYVPKEGDGSDKGNKRKMASLLFSMGNTILLILVTAVAVAIVIINRASTSESIFEVKLEEACQQEFEEQLHLKGYSRLLEFRPSNNSSFFYEKTPNVQSKICQTLLVSDSWKCK